MTIEGAALLKPGDRILVKKDKRTRMENATVIEHPGEGKAVPGHGFLWVRFDGAGIDDIREYTIHAREILQKQ